LIDAFAAVLVQRPAVLAIVGDGPEREALSTHAAALGIGQSVVFTGMCPNPERLLPSFNIFAISSDTEQMPLSVLEAMAAGRAVVATDVGDVREMLAPENHPFVVRKDAAILSVALRALLGDERRASAIGTANARRARTLFDQEVMFMRYKTLFEGTAPSGPWHPGRCSASSF
jgi:glycosyltransferase involved in cell wall biosynthesis